MSELIKQEDAERGEPKRIPVDKFARGGDCPACGLERHVVTGRCCPECTALEDEARGKLETLVKGWPGNDAEFEKRSERIRRHYREDVERRKERVAEEKGE
ncbi:MAG: hypothetical protein HRF49_07745 [bacterium]|jgi:hypothetical protein